MKHGSAWLHLGRFLTNPRIAGRTHWIPLPPSYRTRYASPGKPWDVVLPPIADELKSQPGIGRDPESEQAAFEAAPLQNFVAVHEDAFMWELKKDVESYLPIAPLLARAEREIEKVAHASPTGTAAPDADPQQLTEDLRLVARSRGVGAIGVTRFDPRYAYEQVRGDEVGDRVVVIAVEQKYEPTQQTPSAETNRAANYAEGEAQLHAAALCTYLQSLGYLARPHTTYLSDGGMVIAYAVAAGLGQMGLNGQLLTPASGPRVRLALLTTNAPLVFDEPVDYGIEGVCDRCKACVRRCPVGAIPPRRKLYRGVMKAKIKTARCFPTVAQADGCGICMAVCPVQKYGLTEVLEEYNRSGTIKGRETAELESYVWPLDGKRYGPGERPKLPREFVTPEGFPYDPERTLPLPPRTRPRRVELPWPVRRGDR